jgi:hypothetical protein
MTREEAVLDRLVRVELRGMAFEGKNPATGRKVRGTHMPPPQPGPRKPRRTLPPRSVCPPSRHELLQRNVHNICDAGLSCENLMPPAHVMAMPRGERPYGKCNEINARKVRAQECVNARTVINQECFGGGDSRHRKAVNLARNALIKCGKAWQENNCHAWNEARVARGQKSRHFFD